ncbi:MAG TPA: hypothetical protein VN207_12435 [Ktedonobacteraceae bacterium]|nr:hypothetical protein [Ktedonobacteraceae bacterium]
MGRIRTGQPNGRPPLTREQREGTVDTHMNLPVDVIEKIDRMKKSNESRKDFIVRVIRELADD